MGHDRDAAWSLLCRHCGIEALLLQFALIPPMLFWRQIATVLMLDRLTQFQIAELLGIANFLAMGVSAIVAVATFAAGMWHGRNHWILLAITEGALAYGHALAFGCMMPYINE